MENDKRDLGASAFAETGSHASHGAAEASPPIGFDPAREVFDMWLRLARATAELVRTSDDWAFDEPKSTRQVIEWADLAETCFGRAASAMSAFGQDAQRLEGDSPASAPGRPDAV